MALSADAAAAAADDDGDADRTAILTSTRGYMPQLEPFFGAGDADRSVAPSPWPTLWDTPSSPHSNVCNGVKRYVTLWDTPPSPHSTVCNGRHVTVCNVM